MISATWYANNQATEKNKRKMRIRIEESEDALSYHKTELDGQTETY